LEVAWDVAGRLRAHGTYGSLAKAAKALSRRCPGFSARQYDNAIRKGLALYDAAVEVVAANVLSLLRQTNVAANQFPDFRSLAQRLRRRNPGFRLSTCRAALSWVWFWHHLK
jgi:hypothetical protein